MIYTVYCRNRNTYLPTKKSLTTRTAFLFFLYHRLLQLHMPRVIHHWKKMEKNSQTTINITISTTSFMSFLMLVDINECVSGAHDCHSVASCTNTIGSFSCSCNHPYTGDGKTCRLVAGKYVSFIPPKLCKKVKSNTFNLKLYYDIFQFFLLLIIRMF